MLARVLVFVVCCVAATNAIAKPMPRTRYFENARIVASTAPTRFDAGVIAPFVKLTVVEGDVRTNVYVLAMMHTDVFPAVGSLCSMSARPGYVEWVEGGVSEQYPLVAEHLRCDGQEFPRRG